MHGLQAWREDLEELTATGSSPSKETVMSSLRLLIGGVRELKMVTEITELMSPGDVKRLHQVVQKKAAEWAVLDSDPRMSSGYVVNAMAVAKSEVCRFVAKGSCSRGKECRYSHDSGGRASKGGGKGSKKGQKGKGATDKKDWNKCFNCGKITDPPHRAKDCPEAKRQPKVTAAPKHATKAGHGKGAAASSAGAGPPGLGQTDKLQELAKAYMAELSRGSSSQDLLRKLMCPVVLTAVPHYGGGFVMVGDTGAEVHII